MIDVERFKLALAECTASVLENPEKIALSLVCCSPHRSVSIRTKFASELLTAVHSAVMIEVATRC